MYVRATLLCSVLLLAASLTSFAQDRLWTFNVGAGPTAAIGTMHNRLNTGWNINVGGGLNFANPFAVIAEFGYNSNSLTDQALAQLRVPDGNSRIYSVTINPMLRLGYGRRLGAYLIAGGGWYRRTVEFTRPTVAVVPFYDPWWGFFGSTVIPADVVLGSRTVNTGGWNAGGGFTFGAPEGAKLYTEVRYHWMNAGSHNTTILPITIGVRF